MGIIHPSHIGIHFWANTFAGGKKIFRYIHLPFYIPFGNILSVLIGK